MLSVLLFNWLGYRLLTAYWEGCAAARLEAGLDNDRYDPAQLILLRVPADALPYSNSSARFERSVGFIEIGATRYRTVKRRLYNDSIEFLCIPDGAANQLRSAKVDFFRLVNDLQRSGHSKFPGPSGKTDLPYFAARPVPSPLFLRADLPAGHSRIGLQPPRQDNSLS